MRLTAIAAALIIATVSAPAVQAHTADPAQSERSAAWREAQALIDGVDAPELFENLSVGNDMRIRHKASGLVCVFSPGEQNNSLRLFPGLPQGDDVGCNADVGNIYMTVYATRYRPAISVEDAIESAANGIRNRFPDARPYSGPVLVPDVPDGAGEPGYVAFVVGQGDRSLYAHARVAKVGEWIFKQRMSTPEAMAVGAEALISVGRWTDVLEAATSR